MEGSVKGTYELREDQARAVVAVGGVSAADRGYLAAGLPLLMLSLARTSAREHGRTARRRRRGGGKALTEAQPSFERVNYVLAGLSDGSAALVVCRIPYNIIENYSNQLLNCYHS
jgi:hypothetical protein